MKVLSFTQNTKPSQKHQTSEVTSVNFRTKEVTKIVETNNQTNRVVSSFEMLDNSKEFMGSGFGEFVSVALAKFAK